MSWGGLEGVSWKTSWGRLLVNVSRTSLGRCLEDVSWKTSWGRFLEDVLRTFPGRRPEDVLKKKVVATSISDQSRTYLRPKLRRFYDVFAMSLCRLGNDQPINILLITMTKLWFSWVWLWLNWICLFFSNQIIQRKFQWTLYIVSSYDGETINTACNF